MLGSWSLSILYYGCSGSDIDGILFVDMSILREDPSVLWHDLYRFLQAKPERRKTMRSWTFATIFLDFSVYVYLEPENTRAFSFRKFPDGKSDTADN